MKSWRGFDGFILTHMHGCTLGEICKTGAVSVNLSENSAAMMAVRCHLNCLRFHIGISRSDAAPAVCPTVESTRHTIEFLQCVKVN